MLRISKTAKKNCCNEQKQQFFVGEKNHYPSFAVYTCLVLSATPLIIFINIYLLIFTISMKISKIHIINLYLIIVY